jgi:hypothetical protein
MSLSCEAHTKTIANSGSQIMASVMALQEGWFSDAESKTVEPLQFEGE